MSYPDMDALRDGLKEAIDATQRVFESEEWDPAWEHDMVGNAHELIALALTKLQDAKDLI